MADYYTEFCIPLYFNADAIQWAEDTILTLTSFADGDTTGSDVDALLSDFDDKFRDELEFGSYLGFELLLEEDKAYIESSNGTPETAAYFLQTMLRKFGEPGAHADFQWSQSSSRLEPGVDGGGAAFITADEVKMFSTTEWVREQLEKIAASSPKM